MNIYEGKSKFIIKIGDGKDRKLKRVTMYKDERTEIINRKAADLWVII